MVTRIYYIAVAVAVVAFGMVSLGVGAMGIALTPTDATSVITVTSTDDSVADDGVCTLREAITAANTDSPSGGTSGECPTGSGDDVLLVPTGTYSVTITGTRENNNATGDFDILNPVTILATGPVTLAVNEIDRAFHVLPTAALTISGFYITNAHAPDGASGVGTYGEDGGTFLSEGDLSVFNTTAVDSKAGRGVDVGNGGHGGTIAHTGNGHLHLFNSSILDSATGNSGYGGNGGDGGGLYLNGTGTAFLESVIISGTYNGWGAGLAGKGGAIAVIGPYSLTLVDSTITNAFAGFGIGGIGGGIYNEGTLIVDSSVISSNIAGYGFSEVDEGREDATAGQDGGGLYNIGSATLRNCMFSNNRAGGGGNDWEFAAPGGRGGGIYHRGSSLIISQCRFVANTAGEGGYGYNYGRGGDGGDGGALVLNGPTTITATIFESNSAGRGGFGDSGGSGGSGGAIFNLGIGAVTVDSSSFYSNTGGIAGGGPFRDGVGGDGGAIVVHGPVTIRRSTFSHNRAGLLEGNGGAIVIMGQLILENVTIAYNEAGVESAEDVIGEGGGIYNLGVVTATNSIIANNRAGYVISDTQGIGADCFGTINSGGYLLVEDAGECTITGNITGNVIGQDPVLAPLADNGGPTLTHAFAGDGPALDAGFCTVTEDQRGYPRPIDLAIATNTSNACDIGAFERQAVNIHSDTLAVKEGGITDTYTLSLTLTPTAPVTITLITDDQVVLSPTSMVFGTTTWSLPQTVTVSAIDDAVVEGQHTAVISHTVTSTDPFYEGVKVAKVQVSITDNDMLPTVTATATSTPLPTRSATPTASTTPTPTSTVIATATGTATSTPTVTYTPTVIGTATATSTPVIPLPTVSPSATPKVGELQELYLPLVLHH